MELRLSVEDVERRLMESPRQNYAFIYSVMKGATVAIAAYTFTVIWTPELRPFLVPTLLFWIVSVVAMILTYTSTDVGIILANFNPSWVDTVFPFLLAIAEFTLFSLLQSPGFINYWYLCFTVYMVIIAIIVHNVVRRVKPDDYQDSPLRKFIEDQWLSQTRKDRNMAILVASVAAICAVLEWRKPFSPTVFHWISTIFFAVLLSAGIVMEERLRSDIRVFIASTKISSDGNRSK